MSADPSPGRVLALDLGRVRIGLAVSDGLGLTAQPLQALARVGPRQDLVSLARLIREQGVRTVVVGLPLLLSGDDGTGAVEARSFAADLAKKLDGIDVQLWDERLTTAEAERVLIAGGVRRGKRRHAVDALAASLILQGYLDARCNPPPDPSRR